eukprot:4589652-Lingulodinium_polyedra.AAC.1
MAPRSEVRWACRRSPAETEATECCDGNSSRVGSRPMGQRSEVFPPGRASATQRTVSGPWSCGLD